MAYPFSWPSRADKTPFSNNTCTYCVVHVDRSWKIQRPWQNSFKYRSNSFSCQNVSGCRCKLIRILSNVSTVISQKCCKPQLLLWSQCQQLGDVIVRREIRHLLKNLTRIVSTCFPEGTLVAVNSCVFLRWIMPAAFSPEGFNLLPGEHTFRFHDTSFYADDEQTAPPSSQNRRTMILVTKGVLYTLPFIDLGKQKCTNWSTLL